MSSFFDFSSWREQSVTLKGGANDIDFLDTKPNMFVVQNANNYELYASISKTATDENYEFVIPKNSSVTLGRPTPTGKLYIFNPVATELTVKVFSVADTFDMNILSKTNISIDGATVNTDGIVRGFANGVQLPSGTNTIGNVNVNSGSLAGLLQAIGNVESANDGNTTAITTAIINMSNAITTALNAQPQKLTPSGLNGMYTTTAEATSVGTTGTKSFDKIIMLSNHSEKDMRVRFYFSGTTDYVEFFVAPHDFISDVEMEVEVVEVYTGEAGCTFSLYGGEY